MSRALIHCPHILLLSWKIEWVWWWWGGSPFGPTLRFFSPLVGEEGCLGASMFSPTGVRPIFQQLPKRREGGATPSHHLSSSTQRSAPVGVRWGDWFFGGGRGGTRSDHHDYHDRRCTNHYRPRQITEIPWSFWRKGSAKCFVAIPIVFIMCRT